MRYLEQSNSERQKVEGWVPGAGRGGNEAYLMGIEFQFYEIKSSGDWLHNHVNELYGLKRLRW